MLCPGVEGSGKLDTDVDVGPRSLLDVALSLREYVGNLWQAYGMVLGKKERKESFKR